MHSALRECHRDYVQLGRSQREALGAVEGNCSGRSNNRRNVELRWRTANPMDGEPGRCQTAKFTASLNEIRSGDDLERPFKEAIKARSRAVAVTQSSVIGANITRIIGLTTGHGLPAIFAIPEYGEAVGLMAYGGSRTDQARRAAIYVTKSSKARNQPSCRLSSRPSLS